uniref:ChSh domain-containing protein n=1 Tax=Trichuris muris TaxID=70415 RepID=A0A5S6QKK9_TRIMR
MAEATTSVAAETEVKEEKEIAEKEQSPPAAAPSAAPSRRSSRMASIQFQRKMRLRESAWKSRTGANSSPVKRNLLGRSRARKRSLLHLDSADELSLEMFELPTAADVEEVVEPRLGSDGRLFFCIKFVNKDETELVPKDVAYAKYPREMIDFYERILEFSVKPM